MANSPCDATGAARNALRTILRGEADEQYGPRAPRPTNLDPHKTYLGARLKAAGEIRLSAVVLIEVLEHLPVMGRRGYSISIKY